MCMLYVGILNPIFNALALFFTCKVIHAQDCIVPHQYRQSCEESPMNLAACTANPLCCYDHSSTPHCYVKQLPALALLPQYLQLQNSLQNVQRPDNLDPIVNAALNNNFGFPADIINNAQGNAINLGLSALSNFNFPLCPVRVPICYRTRCGEDITGAEHNPALCFRDPRCCFDNDLFGYKRMFGQSYMGGAPVCYHGPTSRTYLQIANRIRPWNPFYQETVINLFSSVFESKTLDIDHQTLCNVNNILKRVIIKNPLCGWIGITKLECRLKDCCFNQFTGECSYPNQRLSKQLQVEHNHPELIARSTEETKCSNVPRSGLDSSVYGRLPCLHSQSKKNTFAHTLQCRSVGCCMDYSSLLSNFAPFDSSRNAQRSGINQNLIALLTGQTTVFSTGSETHCPYTFFPLPGLPDLSSLVVGCCYKPTCYHRKLALQPKLPTSLQSYSTTGPLQIPGEPPNDTSTPLQPPLADPTPAWQIWSTWSECSKSCGYGSQTRIRQCVNSDIPSNILSDIVCDGASRDVKICSVDCPHLAVVWGAWQNWEECSASCGFGRQYRHRFCVYENDVNSVANSKSCSGSSVLPRACNGVKCPVWGPWSNYGPCNASCGSPTHHRRYRSCLANNVKVFNSTCNGENFQDKQCYATNCITVDSWTKWSSCSKSCGVGTHNRIRPCYNSTIKLNAACSISIVESQNCSNGSCPENVIRWGHWGAWSKCSATCGSGRKARRRNCVLVARNQTVVHDSLCKAWLSDVQEETSKICWLRPCDSFYAWTTWSNYSACSTTCDVGFSVSHRTCYGPTGPVIPSHCPGEPSRTIMCHGPPCATWKAWTSWGRCTQSCGTGIQIRLRCMSEENSSCIPHSITFDERNCTSINPC